MKRLTFQISFGLIFALPLALITFALARAAGAPAAAPGDEDPQCQDCHAEFQAVWVQGAHGKAVADPTFQSEWEAQSKPKECLGCHTTGYDPVTGNYEAEGVTCNACHTPVASNHPLAPASMSRSASLCGECHRDTYFEWQSSKHGQSDLTCVSCHDPHATDIRATDPASLCASCHGTRVAAFEHSNHAAQGLTCVDCHIGDSNGKDGIMGKGKHSHTFAVDLDKCNTCHEADLHSPAAAMLVAADTTPPPAESGSPSSGGPATVSAEPKPVSPLGFALFTGLIGMAFGIVLAPWLERGFHRIAHGEAHPRQAR
jgi:predicted CXXCH cytochrome family protein